MKQIYSKDFVIEFAEYFKAGDAPVYDAFNTFLDKYLNEPEEPDPNIYHQVLEAAAEMTNVTMMELSSGKKYGDLPSCKQMTSKVLSELKCSEESIALNLPMMGRRGTIHSQIKAASKYEGQEKNYRVVLNQLRSRFGLIK